VARINELTEQINEARTLRSNAAEQAEALTSAYRRATFGEKPKEDWIPLRTFVTSIENGKSPATDGRPASLDEWGVLKVGAVSFGSFNEKQNKALAISFDPPESLQVRPGDFLMSRANTRELVGACAMVRETRPKLMLSDKTFRFVFREPRKIMPEYLEQVLKSPPLREQIERAASGTSSTMKNISKEKVFGLRLPSFELSKQEQIVRELQALQAEVDILTRLQDETANELNAFLPSVLSKAFAGQLY
jgi:type I restriction enzyme, S subunit